MSTVVIGAGLVGLCTARSLLDRGESVRILEAREAVALETSFANGGMLTPSLPEPWNDPGVHRHLAASLFDPKSAMKLRLRALPSLFFWGIRFLRNSSPSRYRQACIDNFRLASFSLARTRELTGRYGLEYSHTRGGTLSVFRSTRDLRGKKAVCDVLAALGMRYELLDGHGIVALEPSLGPVRDELVAGIHFPEDDFGDAHCFCNALAKTIEADGAAVETGQRVTGLELAGKRVRGVRVGDAAIDADRVVIAAGVHSRRLLRPYGIVLPVQPAKGYSVTIDASGLAGSPRIPVLDDTLHAGVTPLAHRLRLVGTAEFAGYDTRIDPVRVDNLFDMLKALFPAVEAGLDRKSAIPWAGLRPMSADGRPLIGATTLEGLYVNAGHGHLGWTMAAGSAELLADLMQGTTPAIDPTAFALAGR